jgi:hypothetical protein
MIRFILDRAIAQARTDMAVVVAVILAALTWPWDLALDLLGVP